MVLPRGGPRGGGGCGAVLASLLGRTCASATLSSAALEVVGVRAASEVKDGTTTAAMKDSCAAQCMRLLALSHMLSCHSAAFAGKHLGHRS